MPSRTHSQPAEHIAAFYQADGFLIERVAAFIGEGLAAGEHVIVLATLDHWNAITARLEDGGIACGRAASEGRLVLIDAKTLLEEITVDGTVDIQRFRATLGPLLTPGPKRRVYGELVSLLAQRGDVDAAVAIENLGHELAHGLQIPVLCGYDAAGSHELTRDDVARIEQAHDRSVFQAKPESLTDSPSGSADQAPSHAVRFYENQQSLAKIVGQFIGEGFVAGLPAIVIATPEHRDAIRAVLNRHYFDVDRIEQGGDLIMVDAEEVLAAFMEEGLPNPGRFRHSIVPLIERACRARNDCVIRAYGEMVDVLWKAGHTAAAVRLEMLWNQLAQTHQFALLCGYSMGNFYKDAAQQEISDLHTHVSSDTRGPDTIQ